jgi:hypothetical protein
MPFPRAHASHSLRHARRSAMSRHARRKLIDDRTAAQLRQLIDPSRLRLWPLVWVLAVCIAATVIGLAGPSWLARGGQSPAEPHLSDAGPASPPARVCGNDSVLGGGPSSAPPGAVTVPAGDDSGINWSRRHTTYWFAPGVHTLGSGQYTQIVAGAGSTYVGAPGAVIDGKRTNYYAFSGTAPHVTISYLTVRGFGTRGGNENEGVVNHNSAARWTIDHSTLRNNAGAAAMLGRHNTLLYDCLKDNQQYGFNAYSKTGPAHVVVEHNEIAGNDTYNWEKHDLGCGCTGGGKFWNVNGAIIKDNWVHGNHSAGLWADTNNRDFDIEGNYIAGNYSSGLIYEISYNALVKGNAFIRNGLGAGPANPGFPTGAIYVSESGADSRVPGKYGQTFSITQNTFKNNWGGVVLWENADRFCASPANTSTGSCTLVDPAVVTLKTCNASNIANRPYYSDCRWKTQNVLVDHNVFDLDPGSIGPSCTAANACGIQGLFSQFGSYPSWSPYEKRSVENHITLGQNNHFRDNIYEGPWQFMVHEQGNVVPWVMWQGSPYDQDPGSTMSPRRA